MATQKVKPDPDAQDRRDLRHQRRQTYRKVGTLGLATAVFVAVVAAAFALWSSRSPDATTVGLPLAAGSTVTGPTETVGPVPETDHLLDLRTGETTPLPKRIVGTKDVTGDYAVSPDGSSLAYVAGADQGRYQILVANLDGTGIEQVTVELRGGAMPSRLAAPAWSPDGSKIAYVGRGGALGNVYMLDLATGVSTRVTYDPRDGANAPSFSPDGSSIVYGAHRKRGDDQVLIVPVAGGTSVTLVGGDAVSNDSPLVLSPALSPDGSLLSYECQASLCLANADGTDARVLVYGEYTGGSWSPDGTRIAFWRSNGGCCGSANHGVVYVMDVATGDVTPLAEGAHPRWLGDHTLIVETDACNHPHDNCGG